jgi:3-oxoacyl-[acyl-carrier protein] reductase
VDPAPELQGQVALVTGGGRGIGRLIARELTDAGMRVAVAARSAGQVEQTAQEIDGLAVTADVSKQEDVEVMTATVERELGPIDLLVNNAGVGPSRTLPWEEDPADWWRVFEINVLGPYLCCRAVLPGMVERGRGRIVNTGSGASYLPLGAPTSYGASKAALGRFGELLVRQVAEFGIAVFTTPPELARRLVRALASGCADRLRRPLHPRRARRRRRAGRACRRDRAARPERDPAATLSVRSAPIASRAACFSFA